MICFFQCKQAKAGFLAILFLLLLAFATSPGLHRAIHSDASEATHHCAITLLSHGQIDAPVFDLPVCFALTWSDSAPLFYLSANGSAVEFLPPGRGPPILAS